MTDRPQTSLPVEARSESGVPVRRILAAEVAVALTYNGSTQAVMMATPADLADFARGFTLTEGLADPADITGIETLGTPQGIDLRIWLRPDAATRLAERRRDRAGPVGCGLCGIDSLAEAVAPPPAVPRSPLHLTPADIATAMAALPGAQPLHDATRAVHGAGFWVPGWGMVAVREDVGRHNALDKLAGALMAAGQDATQGAVILTSRVSIDLVQKTARLGAPVVIAVSAPTAAAVALADSAGITLVALARGDRFEVFTHPARLALDEVAHVA